MHRRIEQRARNACCDGRFRDTFPVSALNAVGRYPIGVGPDGSQLVHPQQDFLNSANAAQHAAFRRTVAATTPNDSWLQCRLQLETEQ